MKELGFAWLLRRHLAHLRAFVRDALPDPVVQRNARFRNVHNGQRCFILGSGNSINSQDLTRLRGEIVMTQNHFHAHPDIAAIAPTYHVNVPKYQPMEYDQDWSEWLGTMDERLPRNTILFFDKNTKYLVDANGYFADRVYYIKTGYNEFVANSAPVDLTNSLMSVPTVLTQCLAIAIYMGFAEIYLLGFDLDQVCRMHDRTSVRFYGLSPITANKYEEEAEQSLGASGGDWLAMWRIWRQCGLLKAEADRRGIRIYNATEGGLLNVYERCAYDGISL